MLQEEQNKEDKNMTKHLLLVETDDFLIEFLKKKTSEPRGMKHMNGKRRCTAHGHLVEKYPCQDCLKEGKTETYEDWFE